MSCTEDAEGGGPVARAEDGGPRGSDEKPPRAPEGGAGPGGQHRGGWACRPQESCPISDPCCRFREILTSVKKAGALDQGKVSGLCGCGDRPNQGRRTESDHSPCGGGKPKPHPNPQPPQAPGLLRAPQPPVCVQGAHTQTRGPLKTQEPGPGPASRPPQDGPEAPLRVTPTPDNGPSGSHRSCLRAGSVPVSGEHGAQHRRAEPQAGVRPAVGVGALPEPGPRPPRRATPADRTALWPAVTCPRQHRHRDALGSTSEKLRQVSTPEQIRGCHLRA